MTPDELARMITPLEENFSAGTRKFIEEMIIPSTDQTLREWILADISAAAKSVAHSATREMMSQYITGEAAKIFDEIMVSCMLPTCIVKYHSEKFFVILHY